MSERIAYFTRSGRGAQFPVDAVQDSVDEATRLGGPELLGDLDGLVDGDLAGHARLEEQLVDGQPQDVAIDDGHAVQVPVLGALRDALVDLALLSLGALDEGVGKGTSLVVDRVTCPEVGLERTRVGGAVLLQLIEELQRELAGLADRKSTRLNSSHGYISYAVFCLKKK